VSSPAAALETFARRTRSYIVMSTVFGLIVAILDTIALLIPGILRPTDRQYGVGIRRTGVFSSR